MPIELAREIVYGAVAYARSLGFAPAPGFKAAADHLGPASGPSSIGFGLRTLERSVGHGNFDFLVTAEPPPGGSTESAKVEIPHTSGQFSGR